MASACPATRVVQTVAGQPAALEGATVLLRDTVVGMLIACAIVAFGCSSAGGSRVLANGEGWQLAVVGGAELQFRQGPKSTSGVSDYTRPVTLNEAHAFYPEGQAMTVVAGPVTDEAQKVVVTVEGGEKSSADLTSSHGLQWFWVVLAGQQTVVGIVARDDSGAVVDEYTHPPMPGPPPKGGPEPPPP
jgi:hypothetical protein